MKRQFVALDTGNGYGAPPPPPPPPPNPPVSTNYPNGLPPSTGPVTPFDNSRQWMYVPGGQPPGATSAPTIPGQPPAAGPAPTSPSVDPAVDLANKNAQARLNATLDQYGLGSLDSWAWQRIVNGESMDEILQDLRQTNEYKQRFSGMLTRQKNGYNAISEGDYISYENTARGLMRAAGLPPGFYDQPDDFATLIGNDVSPTELQARVNNGVAKVMQAPAEVRAAFGQFYGANGDGNLAAYFLDPDKAEPVLERQVQAASIAGTGNRFGVGISRDMAETLARKGLSDADAQTGFEKLAETQPLFNDTITEQSGLRADVQGAEAVFGLGGGAQQELERRQEERQAQFQGAGSAAAVSTGISGLGRARSY